MPAPVPPVLPVIGIDAGGGDATGVVVLGADLSVRYAKVIAPGCKGPERLCAVYDTLDEVARMYGPFLVAMREGYAMGATNRPYLMGEIGGLVQVALYPYSARLLACAPAALKKFVMGNASATKSEVMASLRKRKWFDTDDDDLADAYGLARIAACVAGYDTTIERPAREVLDVILAEVPAKRAAKRAPRARPGVSKHEVFGDE